MKTQDKQLLTHSRQDAFKTCRRKHYYTYELGLRRIDDARALRMGSAFHAAIEALSKTPAEHVLLTPADCNCGGAYCNICEGGLGYCKVCHGGESDLDQPCNLRVACDTIHKRYARVPELADPYWWSIERETLLRLVCGYAWRWSSMPLEYVATEHAFQVPLVNPATGAETPIFDLAGKIDGIVRLEDGRLAVKETKTTSDDLGIEAPLWRRLRIDHQISLYIHAARREGYDVATVLYDVVRKPTIQATPVPLLDPDGLKIVLDANGHRVHNASVKAKKTCPKCAGAGVDAAQLPCSCTLGPWRQTGDTEKGYVVQTRQMTPEEWGEKLSADIAERPDFYFARREVARLNSDVDEYQAELWEIQQAIREAQRTGRWYRTVNRNTCEYCPYFDLCSSSQQLDRNNPPPGFHFVDDVHPELERRPASTLNGDQHVSDSTPAGAAGTASANPAAAERLPASDAV